MNIFSPVFARQYTFIGLSTGGAILAAGAIGGLGAIGGSLISANANGGAPGIEDNFVQGPDFQQGQDQQKSWLDQLNADKADPNWGGISPDWNDIWQQTQQHINNYYNGSAMTPGVRDQVKASFAQRGMAGDPAASFLDSQVGSAQASELNNAQMQQNITKQTFVNNAKNNWFTNMRSFNDSTMQEQGNWTGGIPYATPGQQIGNAIGAAGSGLAQYGIQAQGQNAQLDWLKTYLAGTTGNPSSYAPGVNTNAPTTSNWVSGTWQ